MLMGPFFCYRRVSYEVRHQPPGDDGAGVGRAGGHGRGQTSVRGPASRVIDHLHPSQGAVLHRVGAGTGASGLRAVWRLRRLWRVPPLPRGRARAMAAVAPRQDDQAHRRGHHRRQLRRWHQAVGARPVVRVRPRGRAAVHASHPSGTVRPRPTASTTRSGRSAIRAICRICPTAACTCCRRSGTSRAGAGSTGRRSRPSPTAPTT